MQAAIYNRVSTREQAEHGHNLRGDTERCLDRIDGESGWQHVGTYEDGGRQGDDQTREAYQQLLADVAAGAIDVIVIPALDRFGRDAVEIQTKLALFYRTASASSRCGRRSSATRRRDGSRAASSRSSRSSRRRRQSGA